VRREEKVWGGRIPWITLSIYSFRVVGEQTAKTEVLFLSPAGQKKKKKAHKSPRRKMPCLSASLCVSSSHAFKDHTPGFSFICLRKKLSWNHKEWGITADLFEQSFISKYFIYPNCAYALYVL
jgi:hypothetical protein